MVHDFSKVPQDLRDYPQWVVWKFVDNGGHKLDKELFSVKNGYHASSTNPETWVTFADAVSCCEVKGYDGIGFVLAENDPFTFVDLDDPWEKKADGEYKYPDPEAVFEVQRKIYKEFTCYAERSPSGRGLHLVCRGHVTSGRKRGGVEVYSSGRYMTVTGEVYRDAPINEQQALIGILWEELGAHVNNYVYGGDMVESLEDQEVIDRCRNMVNGDKFERLIQGDFSDYPSQSEADLALMNFLAFNAQHRTQLMRLFRSTPLGQREKAQRLGYMNYTINRAFDQMVPPLDFDGLKNQIEDALTEAKHDKLREVMSAKIEAALAPQVVSSPMPKAKPVYDLPKKSKRDIPPPPGLMGEVAKFIHDSSIRPVPEIALAGAIGLFAGVCGRAYNVSDTGLNMYTMLLASTGTGKEAIDTGITKFMHYVEQGGLEQRDLPAMPAVREFLGPAEISSGQALTRHLSTQRSFVSIIGEVGMMMKRIAHPRASSADLALRKNLLDYYTKSGHGKTVRPSIFSEKDKNTAEVLSPAVSILGEGTPSTFYAAVDEELVSDGLLPRFLIIEYDGKRVSANEDHAKVLPKESVVKAFCGICEASLKQNSFNQVTTVQTDQEATAFLKRVEEHADDVINLDDQTEVLRQLWNRVGLKTKKLAALVAVGKNWTTPVIDMECATWAYNLVLRDVEGISNKFALGVVGDNSTESRQSLDIRKAIRDYLNTDYQGVKGYNVKLEMFNDRVIPHIYMSNRLRNLSAFKHDKLGATNAIRRSIQILIDEGAISQVGAKDLIEKYKCTPSTKAYAITNPKLIL